MKDLSDWACIGSSKRQKEREGEKGGGGGYLGQSLQRVNNF